MLATYSTNRIIQYENNMLVKGEEERKVYGKAGQLSMKLTEYV